MLDGSKGREGEECGRTRSSDQQDTSVRSLFGSDLCPGLASMCTGCGSGVDELVGLEIRALLKSY